MQHLQYGNYDIRYMVYVRKMADIKGTLFELIARRQKANKKVSYQMRTS